MTYDAFEIGEQTGRPVEVYRFSLGGDVYRYTSAEDQVVNLGETFDPIAIKRGRIAQGPEERSKPLEVTMPHSAAFARRFAGIVPGQQALLTLRRYQRDDGGAPETRVIFIGTVHAARFGDEAKTLIFPVYSLEYGLAKTVPRMGFQALCNHILYDDDCEVDEDAPANKFTSVVTAVDGYDVTVTGAGAFGGGGQFPAGFLKPEGLDDYRLVIAQTGDVLTLMMPFPQTLIGSTVSVYRGCDHLIDGHCSTRFNNVGNHGGWAFVPKKNIFATGLD